MSLTCGRGPSAARRFRHQSSQLNHPHICTIHEVGEADGHVYVAMELVEGEPLSERLARGALPPEELLRLGGQIADALAHAHAHAVVHRDLKSANVVVTPEGRAKVLDFGLAKRLAEHELDEATRSMVSLTAPGMVVGTLAYMAPEQLRGGAALDATRAGTTASWAAWRDRLARRRAVSPLSSTALGRDGTPRPTPAGRVACASA